MHRFSLFCFAVLLFSPARGETVLALPFVNLSNSSSLDWIGESIAETVRESLAAEHVLALSRDSREEAYRRLSIRPYARITTASIIKLGEVCGADRVIHGTFAAVQASGNGVASKGSLEITASVVDLRQMRQVRDVKASGALEELARVQERLAWRILGQFLDARAMPSEEQFRRRRPPVRLDAMENHIRGLLATDAAQKHRHFTQAARLDPNFSQPCFQLGRLRVRNRDYRVAAGWLERVTSSNPHFREATFLLGVCRYHMGDYPKAQTAFQSVVEQAPAPEVWNNLGAVQSRLNLSDAIDSFEKALESDPADPIYTFNVGYALWRLGEHDDAAESFRSVLDRAPEDSVAQTMLGRCVKKIGPRGTETRVESLERLKESFDETTYWRDHRPVTGQNH